ncbi:MAG: MBL fold metallo-hydrolase [Planctomycetota bacterium]|nr:MBL fold metallo-hydrolase [Planctomycetota bacterium]
MSTQHPMSRRAFVVATGLAAAGSAIAMSSRSFARARHEPDDGIVARMRKQASTARVHTQSLRGGVSVLAGAGGNIAVVSGPDGKVLVDSGISTARRQVEEALAAIDGHPIRYLVNTHWHFDHTDGNAWMHAAGAVVVASANCRTRLSQATRVDGWNFTFPPSTAGAIPQITPGDSLTLHLGGSTLVLEALGPAHTDTDLLVEFQEAAVMHVGDVWWNGHYPFIDYSTGGSIDGTISAVDTCLARAKESTIIIPGHGPVGDASQLAEFREMLIKVRERVARMKKQGKTLAEVITARPTLEFDPRYGHFLMAPADFTGLVYSGV